VPRRTHSVAAPRPTVAAQRRQADALDRLARAGRLYGQRPDAPEWRQPEGAPAGARETPASGLLVERFRPARAVESRA
jgi:hypothetical protein